MLILTLRKDEKIIIGENIIITLTEIRGKEVKIGIEAPSNVLVLRDKLVKNDQAG
jgi:carbon storage regulator